MTEYNNSDIKLAALAHGCSEDDAISLGYVDLLIEERAKHRLSIDRESYKQKRRSEYPPIQDYIDGVVKGDQAQIQAYIDACQEVKVKYPKPV